MIVTIIVTTNVTILMRTVRVESKVGSMLMRFQQGTAFSSREKTCSDAEQVFTLKEARVKRAATGRVAVRVAPNGPTRPVW
jgi:hypothetical protein